MNVAFFTPLEGIHGGVRVIIKIANALKAAGHEVYIVCANKPEKTIAQIETPVITEKELENIGILDMAIATWWPTAWQAQRVPSRLKGYLVQHDERLSSQNPIIVEATYWAKWDFCIVDSPWLERLVRSFGQTDVHVFSPAYEPKYFKPYDNKLPNRILFFSRPLERKNYVLGMAALERIKKARYDLEIVTFDSDPQQDFWFVDKHIVSPINEELGKLYSSSTVYMQSTTLEGYGQLCLESMACGTAVVTPDLVGTEMLGRNAIAFAGPTVQEIANKCIELVDDSEKRARFEKEGRLVASTISWEGSLNKVVTFMNDQRRKFQ